MALIIYAKIGTLPAGYVHVKGKRKAPVVGEKLKVRDPDVRGAEWEPVKVTEIRDVGRQKLYFVERW